MKTKTIGAILLATCMVTGVSLAADLNEADQRWKAAVEQKIAAGPTTISTPSEQRMKLARQIAAQKGRKSEVTKTDAGYRVKVL
jgi:hypothetical protein